MQTKELRVKYLMGHSAWALAHGDSLMKFEEKTLFADRDELVGILRDEGLNVDFAGYVTA